MSDEEDSWEADFWRGIIKEEYERRNFPYVVPPRPKEFPKLGFGSARARFAKGTTRFDTTINKETNLCLNSLSYEPKKPLKHVPTINFKNISRKPFVREDEDLMGPGKYEVSRWPPQCFRAHPLPFNSACPRILHDPPNPSPGVYTYEKEAKTRKLPFHQSFGGRPWLEAATILRCSPIFEDFCSQCGAKPEGDYYHNGRVPLCLECFKEEAKAKTNPIEKFALNKFKLARYCSFMHVHEGPTAVKQLISKKQLYKLLVRECYLSNYISDGNAV